jgi:ferric iron reductase protein FhuF
MYNDKEIFYQILFREVDNLISNFNNPLLNMFSDPAKHYLQVMIEPYINAFLEPPNNSLNVEMASEFLKEEADAKITKFKEKFKRIKKLNDDPYAD